MKSIAFYFSSVEGHNFEYFVYYYEKCKQETDSVYMFFVPDSKIIKDYHERNKSNHINTIFLLGEKEDITNISTYFRKYRILKNIIKEYRPTDIFFENLMINIFSIFLLSRKKVSFHGIIYDLFLRRDKRSIQSWIQYTLFKLTKNLKSVFVLNDEYSANKLNKIFKTKKFKYLPDPIQKAINNPNDKDNGTIKLVHLGVLSKRKGTLELFKTVELLSKSSVTKYEFTIAGSVSEDIIDEYKLFVSEYANNPIIKIYKGFVSYEQFHEIIQNSHFVILPYSKVSKSSGIIGFSALYEKPLLYPPKGLIGEISEKYMLGYSIDPINSQTMYKFLMENDMSTLYHKYKEHTKAKLYCEINSIENFQNTIFDSLNKPIS